jgi:transcriptional regulator with XRE-family HTH domain
MFTVAKAARLRPDDIAKLCKVSRCTASLWMNGHTKPHHLLRDRVAGVLAAIKAAMEAGDFPIPHEISRRERDLFVKNTVEAHTPEVVHVPRVSKKMHPVS